MVNFYNDYVTCSEKATISDVAGELQGQPSPSANHREGPTSQQHLVFSLILSSRRRPLRPLEEDRRA